MITECMAMANSMTIALIMSDRSPKAEVALAPGEVARASE
jgi:hypothetical protein